MRPLRIKASGTPIASDNFQGLQAMTDAEINEYLSYVVTNKFATDTDGTGAGELNVDTANLLTGSAIGTFIDTIRDETIGTHPATGATTPTTYYFKQVTAAVAESITNRPVGWDNGVNEFTDAELDVDILDKIIQDMVTETDYTVGQYQLKATSPVGGTWTSRYTITDTRQSGNLTTTLWQKTAPTSSANADLTALKIENQTSLRGMTAAEIEQIVPNFRNRIVEDYGTTPGVGCYLVQATAPTETGTWVQMGDDLIDTRQENLDDAYAGNFDQAFTGAYTGTQDYTGAYTGTFTGVYTGDYDFSYSGFTAVFTGSYTGGYDQTFTGPYTGEADFTGAYTGTFTGAYSGLTIQATTEDVTNLKLWLRTA